MSTLKLFSCLQSLSVALLWDVARKGWQNTAPPAGRRRDHHMQVKLDDFSTPLIQQNQEQDDTSKYFYRITKTG